MLLFFYNHASYIPVGLDHNEVDGAMGLRPCCMQDFGDGLVEFVA